MQHLVNTLLKGVADTQVWLNTPQLLNSILMPTNTYLLEDGAKKRTYFFKQGQRIRVKYNAVIDCHEENAATHEIVNCYGTEHHSHSLELRNLLNNEIENLSL